MLQNDDLSTLIEKKKEKIQAEDKLDNYVKEILEKKRSLLDKLDEITEEKIRPIKEEISQIETDIYRIMSETGQEKIKSDTYSAYMNDIMSVRITDKEKALKWLSSHPSLLKKDIIKASELNKMIKEGIVPDPEKDGVDCNDTYQKITYRRK